MENSFQVHAAENINYCKICGISFCVKKIVINGKKIKTNYKIGGIEINPEELDFKPEEELLIQIDSKKDCEPTFHSKGFRVQRD